MNHYLLHQQSVILPFLRESRSVLDFGCGDLTLATVLAKTLPSVHITGIDVVDCHPRQTKRVRFHVYDGTTLPYKNRSFDTVYAYHAFHHTKDPHVALQECARVAKHRILLVESVMRSNMEIPGFMLFDTLANMGRSVHIPMPFHTHTYSWWHDAFQTAHLRVVTTKRVGVFPTFLPIGVTTLFVLQPSI